MKDYKINLNTYILASEKNFIPKNLSISWKTDSYLWMCELQKWLREVHNIKLVIDYHIGNEKYLYRIIKQRHIDNTSLFETYEKALEKALQKALKLIK